MLTDERLLDDSRAGDRKAFGEIVRRYQNLVSSIAYSATGDLTRSEDIAQQTFVTAWQKQGDLRDPSRLVGWLAGIARNLVRRDFRHLRRTPSPTDVAEATTEVVSDEPTPLQHCISAEQRELLWSVLHEIPENYREPLILFYREGHSVADVARLLEISEDSAKQRLSRGRQMLRSEVARFVEDTLSQTSPNEKFVAGVLSALPAPSAAGAAGASVVGKLAAKLVTVNALAWLGPLIGVAGGVFGSWCSLRQATSQPERRYIWKMIGLTTMLVSGLLSTMLYVSAKHPQLYASMLFQGSLWATYSILLTMTITVGNRRLAQIKLEHGTDEDREAIQQSVMKPAPVAGIRSGMVGGLVGSTAWAVLSALLAGDFVGALAIGVLVLAATGWFWNQAIRSESDSAMQSRLNRQAILLGEETCNTR